MAIADVINFVKKLGNREEKEELPDDETRDKYLRSLRREHRVQMEEKEKEMLKKKIAAHKLNHERKYVWGVKDKVRNAKRKAITKRQLRRRQSANILQNRGRFL